MSFVLQQEDKDLPHSCPSSSCFRLPSSKLFSSLQSGEKRLASLASSRPALLNKLREIPTRCRNKSEREPAKLLR